jgi:hypothetical protein
LRAGRAGHAPAIGILTTPGLFQADCGEKYRRAGTADFQLTLFYGLSWKEETMPIFILWAVPAAIVLAGGTYLVFLR